MTWRASVIGLLCLANTAFAQRSNERCKMMAASGKPVLLDSLSAIAGSLTADGLPFENYNLSTGQITLPSSPRQDSVQVCYNVYPIGLHRAVFHRSLSLYDSNAYFKDPEKPAAWVRQEQLFNTPELYKSGSLSRGISFGNNQDVFVNSALNLHLDGRLTDNLFISASLTDQNVPYQPEGNTQQLQDFDNVSIELYNERFSLSGGDIVLENKTSRFLRYYKNVQGGRAQLNYGAEGSGETYLGFSVAKGRFASVLLEPVEGLAGPYRIPGPDNQLFLLIIAGSESVFADGRRLQRGFDRDYVIDYNTGQLTFTNNILMTQFTRVRVDYEYADRNYSRAITVAGHKQQRGRLSLATDFYREKDNKNRPLLYDLSDDDKLALSQIGDDLDQARVLTADSVGFTNEMVLYKKTTINVPGQGVREVFAYSTHPDSAFYKVAFAEVGHGNGDYVLLTTTANGRVFEWVPPQGGESQGSYAPVATLPTPDKRQMLTLSATYRLSDYEIVFSEWAVSNRDLNLFSDKDDGDNAGLAVKSGVKTEDRKIGFMPGYRIAAYADMEYDDADFTAIDRFRYVEFDRDWNLDGGEATPAADRIINAGLAVENEQDRFSYAITHRKREKQVNGFQHQVAVDKVWRKFRLRSRWFKMNNEQDTLLADWQRFKTDLSYQAGHFVPGYIYQSDHNTVAKKSTDSIGFSAMYFDAHTFYLHNVDTALFKYHLRHTFRTDKTPQGGEVEDFTRSHTTRLTLFKAFEDHTVETVFNYRELRPEQASGIEETISGRTDWSGRWFDDRVKTEMTYAIANSQEPGREFVFIKVPAGQGTHTWRDLNENDVQETGEFFEAINPDERNYARIFTPGNEFVRAYQNLFALRLNIGTPYSQRDVPGIKKLLSRFSNATSWSADTKTTEDDLTTRLLAFARNHNDTELIAERSVLRSTLFFNRASPVYGLDFTYAENRSRQLFANGPESRNETKYQSGLRLNLARQYNITLRYSKADKEVASGFIAGRNYLLRSDEINPQLSWQPSDNMRLTAQYTFTDKQNPGDVENDERERAVLKKWVGEITISKAISSSFNARFQYIDIDFNGKESSQSGYDMLEALRPGNNLVWTVSWQQKVARGLQLNLVYNGRRSEGTKAIHTGRVQVSALF